MNRTELREKLNKIDCDNCNQYDLVNLFESVKLSNEDLNKLSEMVEDKDIHDFLYRKLDIIEESMSSAVERQTLGYKKTKGQIQCNGGEQAKEVEDLLKAKYDNVTTQKGKGGKVIIKFSKNESLGEDFYDDEYDDFELASIYGGDFTYCPVCGARMEYDEDGDHYCPKCKKSGHTLSLIRRGFVKDDNESLSESSNGYFAYHDQIVDALIARCQREGVLSTNSKTLLNQLAEIFGVEQEDIEDESHIDINELIAFCQRQGVLPTTSDELIDDLESLTDLEREDIEGLLDESLSESNSPTIDEIISQFKSSVSDGLLDEETISSMVDDMKKAKSSDDAFDIGNIYTNLNFFRFKDNDEIVRSSKRMGDKEVYFDRELAKPYIEKHQKNESLSEATQSLASFVERQTRNYTKEKGFIQCNHGSQEDEIVSLLKGHYPTVTVEPRGKRGVTVRYSKSVNSSLDEDTVKTNFSDLRKALKRFNENGKYAKQGDWSIAKGGYDLAFEIYYRENPILGGKYPRWKIEPGTELELYNDDDITKKASEIVCSVYNDCYVPVNEDTIKQGSQWVNKGKEGTHGKFKTKKAADAQRKAMFAKGFSVNEEKELKTFRYKATPSGLYGKVSATDKSDAYRKAQGALSYYVDLDEENIEVWEDKTVYESSSKVDVKSLPDDYVLLNSSTINYTDEDIDLYYDCIKEFCNLDEIEYDDLEVTFITDKRDADDWYEETHTASWEYHPDDYKASEYADNYLTKKFPNKITVGDIKKSADDVYEYVKSMFREDAQEEASGKLTPADFEVDEYEEQLKEESARDTMKSVVAKWRSRRSNKDESVEDDSNREKKNNKNIAGIKHL